MGALAESAGRSPFRNANSPVVPGTADHPPRGTGTPLPPRVGATMGPSAGRGQRNALPTWAGDGGRALSIYSPASEVWQVVASQVPKLLGWDKIGGDWENPSDQSGRMCWAN